MQITGRYKKTVFRNEKTGYTVFLLKPDDESMLSVGETSLLVKGNIQLCPPGTPVEADCEEVPGKDGRKEYIMNSYRFCTCTEKGFMEFLTGEVFDGIGEKTAEKIFRITGASVFDFCEKEDAVQVLGKNGIAEKQAKTIVRTIKDLHGMREVLTFILSYGGDYEMARAVYTAYGAGYRERISKNPYLLEPLGVPFAICDHMAKKAGIEPYDRGRAEALIRCAFRETEAEGDTKMSFQHLCAVCRRIEIQANAERFTRPFLIGAAVLECGYRLINENGRLYIQREERYKEEKTIADNIKRLNMFQTDAGTDPETVRNIEKRFGIRYAREQKEAFDLIASPGVKVLTGGPGTGKTTVIRGIIEAYRISHPEAVITLCAPTGCAAKKMSESTGMRASTINRLLKVRPLGNGMLQMKDEFDALESDLLIVDEASMVDTTLLWMLIRAVKNHAVFLLVGDEDQLPSVGCGDILHDLLKTDVLKTCRLKKIFRQAEGSDLLENSVRIREGSETLKVGQGTEIVSCRTEEEMQRIAAEFVKRNYSKNSPGKIRVLCTTKKEDHRAGSIAINRLMHEVYAEKDAPELVYGDKHFSVGEPVIFIENDYRIGFYNGDQGVVEAIEKTVKGTSLKISLDGRTVYLSGKDIDKAELAYAITTHKAQGSECEAAMTLLPANPANMLQREIVYVAATRAKKKNIFLVQGDSLQKAIRNSKKGTRTTGLADRIRQTAGASEKGA